MAILTKLNGGLVPSSNVKIKDNGLIKNVLKFNEFKDANGLREVTLQQILDILTELNITGSTIQEYIDQGLIVNYGNVTFDSSGIYFPGGASTDCLWLGNREDFSIKDNDFYMKINYIPGDKVNAYGRLVHMGPAWGTNDTFSLLDRHNYYPTKLSLGLGSTNGVLISQTDMVKDTPVKIELYKTNGTLYLKINDVVEDTNDTYVKPLSVSDSVNLYLGNTAHTRGEYIQGKVTEFNFMVGTLPF